MNPRIQQLAEQCHHPYSEHHIDLEQFARLIVRECAEVGLDSAEDGDDLDAIMKRVHNNILKHFGVDK